MRRLISIMAICAAVAAGASALRSQAPPASRPNVVLIMSDVYPSVGHGGTYNEDNGGAFGVAAVAWLKWHLMNDTTAKGYFVGASCTLCANPQWKTDSRSLR